MPERRLIAIQGEAGSYSHAAALALYGEEVELLTCATFAALFADVAAGTASLGVVPVENTLAGSVRENYDLLAAHDLHAVAETLVRVRHCLVVRPGTEAGAIRRVASHPVALAQCRRLFERRPELVPVAAHDTAGSIRDLVQQRIAADAAIGSALAARLYGAEIVQEGVEDNAENYTRFLAVSRQPADAAGTVRTSLVFTLPNIPGSLHRALGVFASRRLDLARIESRPLHGRPWEYAFHLDVVGEAGTALHEALVELGCISGKVRVLGVYRDASAVKESE